MGSFPFDYAQGQDDSKTLQRQSSGRVAAEVTADAPVIECLGELDAGVDVFFVVRQECGEDGAACAGASVASGADAAAVPGDDVAGDP